MTIITQRNLVFSDERSTERAKQWRHSRYPAKVSEVIFDHKSGTCSVILDKNNSKSFMSYEFIPGLNWARSCSKEIS